MDVVTCPSCGEENPAKFRLCGFCGTPLASTSAVATPPPPVPVAPPVQPLPTQEVRKLVTLVFSDLKDSTALTASIDGEAMNEIKARYFAAMAAEIVRHGGKVEKYVGDAIMAVFGLIRAHEDDALRAVRAAVGMQTALATLNGELLRVYGVTITNRTGVNTGEVVANIDPDATQNLATGDAVNVTARLEQGAPPNEILIGELTHALVADHVETEELALELKGKTGLVRAFRLLAVRSAPRDEPVQVSPFIGRTDELAVMNATYREVVDGSATRLVAVIGDAGVGKTRLISDFVDARAGEAQVLRGRCLAYGDGITFWPLNDVVTAAAGIGGDDPPATARQRIADLLPEDEPERDEIVARVAAAVGLASTTFPVAELFWGARRLLETLALREPLVLVIDDIHWAEATFLELLEHLVTSATASPILVVCSARPELLSERADWLEGTAAARIDLQPLGAADVDAMIDRLLGETSLSDETRAKVVAAAEGNPLYVELMVSRLREHEGSDEISVPPTISALLAARLDDLTREERAVVDPASVIGLIFPGSAVEELVPDQVRLAVGHHLEDLDRKQFVHPLPDDGDEDVFRFHHILVRDAAYQSLLKRTRAGLHERFAAWAERVNAERGREAEFEEILGYHLEQAVRYRSELGPLDAGGRDLADRAADKLASSGRRAFARGDTPAACNLLSRAVNLLAEGDPKRIVLQAELADAQMEEGRFDEATEVIAAVEIAAGIAGDDRLMALATLGRRTLELYVAGGVGVGDVVADARAAIATFEREDDQAGQARAWRLLMLVQGTAGAYDQAADAAGHVVEHGRAAGDRRLATRGAVGYAATALHGPTPVIEALARCEQLALDVEGDRNAEAIILGVLAQLHAMLGEFDPARALYGKARALLRDLGPSVTAASTSIESSRVEVLAGDFRAAETDLRRDREALMAIGERYYLSTICGLLAGVLEGRDQLGEAESVSIEAETLSDDDDVLSQVLWRSARARVMASTNRAIEAERLAREAVALAKATVYLSLQADTEVDLGIVLNKIGRESDAYAAWASAVELYERKGDVVSASKARALAGGVRT